MHKHLHQPPQGAAGHEFGKHAANGMDGETCKRVEPVAGAKKHQHKGGKKHGKK